MSTIAEELRKAETAQKIADDVYTDPEAIRVALNSRTKLIVLSWLLRHSVEQTFQGNFNEAKVIRELIDELMPESILAKSN